LLAARKTAVETMLRTNFDFRQFHTPASEFSSAAYSVIEVESIRGTLFNYPMSDERSLAIDDARRLRERSAPLITMASNEPDLGLSIVNVELLPVVKAKPTASTVNQHGTLAAATA
jgi:hypothetical protein